MLADLETSQTELIGSLNNSRVMIGSCSLAANLYSTKSILFPLLIAIFSVWKQKLLLLISYTTMITYVTGSAILAQNFGVT